MAQWLTNPQGLPPYDLLMDEVVRKKQEKYPSIDPLSFSNQVEELMRVIAYHETGPQQRNLPEAQQIGGPGRGLFQYELEESSIYPTASGAGRTAMNRLYNLLGDEGLPKWAYKYFDQYFDPLGDVDFSELTEDQQKLLFLADKLQDPIEGNIAAIGEVADSTWWQKYHYKGKEAKESKFQDSKRSYLNNSIRLLQD